MTAAPPLLCAALEIALNRYLALEPDVQAEFARLQGRVIALRADGPGWEFFLCPLASGVQVMEAWPDKPDVRISAPPAALARRVFRGEATGVAGVQVEGDAELLTRVSSLLGRIGFDPEEWLARGVGGAAAHRITDAARALLGWGRGAAATLALDTAEYLREETRDLVHRDDVARWIDGVEDVHARSERLAVRLARLERASR